MEGGAGYWEPTKPVAFFIYKAIIEVDHSFANILITKPSLPVIFYVDWQYVSDLFLGML